MASNGVVYILASRRNGTLYVGVTSDLAGRMHKHRCGDSGFTSRYGVKRLVHTEVYDDIATAITREKAIKKWRRRWKLDLIEQQNPEWHDLAPELCGMDSDSD